ncbi:hypothetical protein BpHYR1_054410 [Brachionus plicatilis]|uniref:Cystatin domain-containing protein n=1 Tax=Brachionus plicatilis TaxID=10195 RepID=A0A3M7QC35_BRAPC|nr:hypothetical protein BpHYR1_054410 [Brachionus plicatilis]
MNFQIGLVILFLAISTVYPECIQNGSKTSDGLLVGNQKQLSIESLNSKSIIQVALNATHLFNLRDNATKNYHKLVCIKSGTSQIVNGILYRFDVTLQKTDCLKTDLDNNSEHGFLSVKSLKNIESCKLTDEKVETVLTVNSMPWKDKEPFILL